MNLVVSVLLVAVLVIAVITLIVGTYAFYRRGLGFASEFPAKHLPVIIAVDVALTVAALSTGAAYGVALIAIHALAYYFGRIRREQHVVADLRSKKDRNDRTS